MTENGSGRKIPPGPVNYDGTSSSVSRGSKVSGFSSLNISFAGCAAGAAGRREGARRAERVGFLAAFLRAGRAAFFRRAADRFGAVFFFFDRLAVFLPRFFAMLDLQKGVVVRARILVPVLT